MGTVLGVEYSIGDGLHGRLAAFVVEHRRRHVGRAYAEGTIDCLQTGGPVTVASGVITNSDLPGANGNRVDFTVYDNGTHDRVGYS